MAASAVKWNKTRVVAFLQSINRLFVDTEGRAIWVMVVCSIVETAIDGCSERDPSGFAPRTDHAEFCAALRGGMPVGTHPRVLNTRPPRSVNPQNGGASNHDRFVSVH